MTPDELKAAAHNFLGASPMELEATCDWCKGRGGSRECDHCQWDPCPKCKGSGWVPTDLGEKILCLVQHNFAAMLREARES